MTNEIKLHHKINLQTANCFKLLIGLLIVFAICSLVNFNTGVALWIGVGCFLCGFLIGLAKHKTIGFYVLSISLGFVVFANSYNQNFITTNYNFPAQNAIINGKVKSILNKKHNKQKIIVQGKFASNTLPSVYNTSILITLIGETDIQIGDNVIIDGHIRPPYESVFEYDFNEVIYAKSIGVNWIGNAYKNKIYIVNKANLFNRITNNVYNAISKQIDSLFTESTAGFIRAIILADKSGLSYEDKNKFSLAGVSHILALSGFHIGIILVIVLFFISLFKPNRWLKFIIFFIFVVLFVFLTGMQASAIRAGLMAIFFMLGKTMFRETNMLNVASMTLLGIIVTNTSLLYSVGFQMSLISVLGIFLFYGILKDRLSILAKNKFLDYIICSFAITLSASLIINPLVVYYFHNLSIIAPLTNLFIIPIFSVGLIFAVITIALSFIYFPIGEVYAYIVELTSKLCFSITDVATSFKYSSISNYDNLLLISILISLSLIYILISKSNKQIVFRLCVSIFLLISTTYILDIDKPNEFKLYVKDKYCLLNIPLKDGSSFVWIADKKPNIKNKQKYYNDEGLKKFIQNSNIKYVGINGNYGKEFTELYCKNITIIELSHQQQRKLEQMYLNKKYIYQIMP